jgi:hypothetical protein
MNAGRVVLRVSSLMQTLPAWWWGGVDMADARQLRLDSERAFRLARAGCRKFFDELNDVGWDLQLQAQKVEREAHENEIESWKYNSDL